MNLLALDLMKRVLAQTGAVLHQALFEAFRHAAFCVHACAVVQIAGFRALKPEVFTSRGFLLRHLYNPPFGHNLSQLASIPLVATEKLHLIARIESPHERVFPSKACGNTFYH